MKTAHTPTSASPLGLPANALRHPRQAPGFTAVRALGQAAGPLALSLASLACSARVVAPQAPSVSAAAPACHATGPGKALARRVFVPGRLEASERDGTFSVRFATAASRCAELEWPSGSEHPASCPEPGRRAAIREESAANLLVAFQAHDQASPQRAAVADDAAHALFGDGLEPSSLAESSPIAGWAPRDANEKPSAFASIGHGRFVVAWVDGDVESRRLYAHSVVEGGPPLGNSVLLSPTDASVIGRPSVVVTPGGDGLVTYVASIDGEFDVLATPIACDMN